MVYYGGSSKAKRVASLVVHNQGGGPMKAGFPYEIGRTDWSSIYIDRQKLSTYQKTPFWLWNVKESRPTWVRPGNYKP